VKGNVVFSQARSNVALLFVSLPGIEYFPGNDYFSEPTAKNLVRNETLSVLKFRIGFSILNILWLLYNSQEFSNTRRIRISGLASIFYISFG
jgi:hypothetical protein